MSDELTPEEEEAFDSLPRERMPAGLEARVVDAMRDHGFLAKRRRMIEVSSGRAAGLLAASIALMIGAYSIGFHRGGGNPALLPVETTQRGDGGRMDAPLTLTPEEKTNAPLAMIPEARVETPGKKADLLAPREAPATERSERRSDVSAESRAAEPSAPSVVSKELAAQSLSARDNLASGAVKGPVTYMLNGSPVTVEAPDSVRVVQDEQGRMLIIYTSDGIIRIRLADAR